MLPQVKRCIIVGLGLIGGSLALGLKRSKFCESVVGIDASQHAVEQGLALGVIDEGYASLQDVAGSFSESDIIFLSVPVLAFPELINSLAPYVKSGATITDGASVKCSVIHAFNDVMGKTPSNFVAGHPIAGSEKSGVTAASAELYANRRCIVCPEAHTDPHHIERVTQMWQSVQADVHQMSAGVHDQVFAATSHLPHVIAFALVDALANSPHSAEVFENAAGGFTGFTRIASSNPRMWKDISLANKQSIIETLDCFSETLEGLRTAIQEDDGQHLEAVYDRAKMARDKFLCAGD